MSLDKIKQIVNSIARIAESEEKIAIPVISAKLRRIAEANPHDQTIISMGKVLGKMVENNKLFISKSDLKNLYTKFYSRNNKFAENFQEELGQSQAVSAAAVPVQNTAPLGQLHDGFSDPVLTNALASAFDKNTPLKLFSNEFATRAKNAVSSNLDVWDLRASKLEVEAGNEYFIVIKADYNTPKGITSIFVPVESNKGRVLQPSVFMSNAGPQELNNINIKNYITKFAGAKLNVRAGDILTVLTREISGGEIISNLEMAVTKIACSKESVGGFGGIVGQSVLDVPRNVEVSIPKSAESGSFAARFESAAGVAEFNFSSEKLNLGRDIILRALAGFGIKNSQISVVGSNESTIFYGVSIFGGKAAFKVPVKISGDKMQSPDVLICNGSIVSFSREGVSSLIVGNMTDSKVAASTSPQHGLSPADLVMNVKSAVSEENYAKAEDALNVLQQSGNVSAYRDAFASYVHGMGVSKVASSEQSCSMIRKTANSSHPICGHTNLPVHKVYQDEHGNCQPLYRKGMEETYQGAFFMNSKIFG